MKKITINMLSQADSVPGQGVGSAYIEQVDLIKECGKDQFNVFINDSKDKDIMHHHSLNVSNYTRLIKTKGINISYVHFLPHTLDGSIKLPKPIFDLFKKYVVKFYRDSDFLVVVNPIFIKELEMYNIPKEKIKYIPNYVSKDTFYKQDSKTINETKKQYNLDLDKRIVLGVGQVQHRKGVVDFIEVAKMMPDTLFVWCGGFSFGNVTDGYKELKQIVENPPANVKFLGIVERSEMNSLYNISDVLFMPSYNELFPMSILEAINSAKPLVLRDLELYEGILFDKYLKGNNNEEFVALFNEIFSSQKEYDKYSNLSTEISEFYSKENVAAMWIEFYSEVYKNRVSIINNRKIKKINEKANKIYKQKEKLELEKLKTEMIKKQKRMIEKMKLDRNQKLLNYRTKLKEETKERELKIKETIAAEKLAKEKMIKEKIMLEKLTKDK